MTKQKYTAGLCNIGEREIAVRQKLLLFALAGTVGFTMLIHFFHYITICFLVFAFIFFTVLLFIEIRTGFCIMFGIFKLHNFKHLGNLDCVNDKHCNRKDRIKALRIVLLSLFLALSYTWIVYKFTS